MLCWHLVTALFCGVLRLDKVGRPPREDEMPAGDAGVPRAIFWWTFKGILRICRFLWICPYSAIQFLPKEEHSCPPKQPTGWESETSAAVMPGCPHRTAALQKRLSKTERDLLSLRTSFARERASWQRKFAELQRMQEALCNHVIFEAGALTGGEQKADNGDGFGERSGEGLGEPGHHHRGSDLSSGGSASSLAPTPSATSASSRSSASSGRSGGPPGPRRVFVPRSPLDLHPGHRVRIMLPSGRIGTGTVRFLGRLRGESELHLGVELHTPDHGARDGRHGGRCYFRCKAGCGAFVPFHKLLMAWE